MKKSKIIDIFVTIVDNYGDMGFACELISALHSEYGELYECVIWTDDAVAMRDFVQKSGIGDIDIDDIAEFGIMRKCAIGISILHTPIPDARFFISHSLILRIDYFSLDPNWVSQNNTEHILSTPDRRIIELIPSPLQGGAGLIPHFPICDYKKPKLQKHITLFTYPGTLDGIDWTSFPSDITIYILDRAHHTTQGPSNMNIVYLDFLPLREYYTLVDTSEFVIIRGEVSGAHMIQGSVPFFWDMYRDIGGFPSAQSAQFLSLIGASSAYGDIHQILNGQKKGIITYSDILCALADTRFGVSCRDNLIHTVKKHIDRSQNSI